jgi:uncharacterized protein
MNLIILGASARAAAFSAHRAGLRPWCVDLYADADLEARFPVRKVPLSTYPHGLFDALAEAPDGPVLYTGGLENYPELIARINRPVWGNPPEVLRRVRDPFLLTAMLRLHGLPALDVRREPPRRGDGRRWLLKPLRGSGGVGIQYYDGRPFDPRVRYLQEYAEGANYSEMYFGDPTDPWPARLLGATAPLDAPWLHAPPFHYAGGYAGNPEASLLHATAVVLVREFGLTGLFGIDAILQPDPKVRAKAVPLEVNPRYTASVELLERTRYQSLLELQATHFEGGKINWSALTAARNPLSQCKAILYARQTLKFPEHGPWEQAFQQRLDEVQYADIPPAGEIISRGHPVLTIFGPEEWAQRDLFLPCEAELHAKIEALDRHLYGS